MIFGNFLEVPPHRIQIFMGDTSPHEQVRPYGDLIDAITFFPEGVGRRVFGCMPTSFNDEQIEQAYPSGLRLSADAGASGAIARTCD